MFFFLVNLFSFPSNFSKCLFLVSRHTHSRWQQPATSPIPYVNTIRKLEHTQSIWNRNETRENENLTIRNKVPLRFEEWNFFSRSLKVWNANERMKPWLKCDERVVSKHTHSLRKQANTFIRSKQAIWMRERGIEIELCFV